MIILSLSFNYLCNYLYNYVLINLKNPKTNFKNSKKISFVLKSINKHFVHIFKTYLLGLIIFPSFLYFKLINNALIIFKINHKNTKNMPFISCNLKFLDKCIGCQIHVNRLVYISRTIDVIA